MAIKSIDLIEVILNKIGVTRTADKDQQFLSKQELLLILAHIEKQEFHIKSLKGEVNEWRGKEAMFKSLEARVEENLKDGNED